MPFSLPVLMYHSISRHRHRLCVPPELFEEHCRALAGDGWRGVSLSEAEGYFLAGQSLPPKSCLFTFDDGYLDNYVYAEPLLRRYGHHGIIFPVVGLIGQGTPRPTLEDMEADPCAGKKLPALDERPNMGRNGKTVRGVALCNWAELARMREAGNMDCAPHSMTHGRVVRELAFARLHRPGGVDSFFDVPPYDMPWGFPCFRLGHALAVRGYMPSAELFALVRRLVPQQAGQAANFLKEKNNRDAVVRAISALPALGVRESEDACRQRLAGEFAECRSVFRERLGVESVSFCWPWGNYGPMALQEARKAGFRLFFTTSRGMNTRGRKNAVRRIPVRGGTGKELLSLVRFASRAFFEEVYSWAYNIF
ncbi:MAG: polysaccharide deacetylase family protein [Desulfovibrio sp.]|jgi:peptidoglycan/xylan/chitin deacetylase (PgdA/CDA1 family)|nr:polysaccharide deacetylase family protein [Desulfovibrio sp.]